MNIRRFRSGDEYAVSALIRRSLLETNTDSPPDEVRWLYDHYTPENVCVNARLGHSYILEEDNRIIGTGTILPNSAVQSEIVAAFLLPEYIGRGYGRILFDTLESDGLFTSAERVWLTSSHMALGFYEKRGYTYTYGWRGLNPDGLLEMEIRPQRHDRNTP